MPDGRQPPAAPVTAVIDAGGTVTTAGDPAAVHPWWSFTKTVIALCALRLVRRGRLALDAPVPGHAFTLLHLLTHTSGLPDYGALPAYRAAVARGDDPWLPARLWDETLAQGMLFAPGGGWAYSNLGMMLARTLVERAADRPLDAVIADEIAGPLGLGSVRLATTRGDLGPRHPGAYHPGWVYHGCLTGTAADAARILHALFAGRLLDPALRDRMLEGRPVGGAIPGRPWTDCGYAVGLMCGTWGGAGRVIGHSGAGPGSVCAVYRLADRPSPVTVAAFAAGAADEGVAECAALRAAPGRDRA